MRDTPFTGPVLAEVRTENLDAAEGSAANGSRIGLLARYIADTVGTAATSLAAIIVKLAKPAANAETDATIAEAVGIKADTAQTTVGTTRSLMAYLKGALNQLADVKSYIGTFTRAFKTQWGTRWDSASDLGTDIGTLISGVAAIPTTAMRGTDNAFLAAVGGAKNDAAAEGAVTNDDTAMAYIKQLVTAIQLIPTTAMRGTDSAFLAAVGGALDDAAAEGAVTDTDTAMAYLKQLVTAIQLIPTTAMRGTDDAALAATALTNATWTDAKAAFLDAKISDIPTTAQRGTDNAFLASVGGALDTAATYAVAADKTAMAYIKGLVASGIVAIGQVDDAAPAATDFDTTLTEASNDHYNGTLMLFISGALTGQARHIDDYTGASKNCAFGSLGANWSEAPADEDWFVLLPSAELSSLYMLKAILEGVTAIPTTPALASVLGALDTAAATGAVSDEKTAMAYIKQLVTSENKVLCSMDFWSAPVEEVSVDGDAGTLAAIATTVVAEVPGTFVRAIGMFKFRAVENTYAGVNKLDGATVAATSQVIQIDDAATTGYVDCITFVDDMFTLAASTREGGDVIIGSTDVAARVDGNDTYTWRWLLSKADQDDINFNDAQFGLRVYYSI